MIRRMALSLVGAVLLGLLVIQLVPVARTNPPVVSEPTWNSPQTRALAQRACFDCHSNETRWTWYAYVAPASWLVANDVHEGRGELNFSDYRTGRGRKASEEVLGGDMPPQMYLFMHPEAKLTTEEKQALASGLDATLGAGRRGQR